MATPTRTLTRHFSKEYLVEGSNTIGIADNTITDVTNASILLPQGEYIVEIGATASFTYSTYPTYANCSLVLTNSSNSVLFSSSSCGITRQSASRGRTRVQQTGRITWSGGTVKLRGLIEVVGGSGTTTRDLELSIIRMTKID